MLKKCVCLFLFLIFEGCSGCKDAPAGIHVVDGFELHRFLGTWYEIARTDNTFQKNLDSVSANYLIDDDGNIRVDNKAYDVKVKRWRYRSGKAVFAGDPNKGAFRASYFGSFYAQYNIIDIDKENYSWALVCGRDKSMLWIISRTTELDHLIVNKLLLEADSLGFDTSRLLYTGFGSGP